MKLEGYSNYEIYPETGQIFNLKTLKFIGSKHKNGYWFVNIKNDNNVYKHWSIHRLVWTVVNGEIPEGMEINHIDENTSNNSITNLSLVTHKENMRWGTVIERIARPQSHSIIAFKNNKPIYYFRSIRQAQQKGFGQKEIVKTIKGDHKQHKGFQFKYFDEYLGDLLEQIQDEDMALEKAS